MPLTFSPSPHLLRVTIQLLAVHLSANLDYTQHSYGSCNFMFGADFFTVIFDLDVDALNIQRIV